MVWVIGICVLVIVLLFSKIYITVNYSFVNNQQRGTILISFLKIPIYKKLIQPHDDKQSILQYLKTENSISNLLQEGKFFLKALKEATPAIYSFIQKLTILQFNWHTKVGAGEASSTGILSGGVWSIKGVIIAFLRETSHIACSLHVNVVPYFQNKIVESQLEMKFSIRLGQAIIGGIKVLRSIGKHPEITISQ